MIQDGISFHRKKPLEVVLYNLNALEKFPLQSFGKVDLVTVIEFIEHIKESDIKILCESIFIDMRPKYAIITTPNKEFNVYFNFV